MRILIMPTLLLLVPAAAMLFTDEVAWGHGDFLLAWLMLVGVGFAYNLVTARSGHPAYRAGTAVALGVGFALVWGNLAVGFIGNEDHPANLMYLGVIAVGIVGAGLARFEARGMARALFATAVVHALVPVIALLIWQPPIDAGLVRVFVLNTAFACLFAFSGLLFRHAAGKMADGGREVAA